MEHSEVPHKYMTVGEVAKKMGVSVRTLQYYDREGILCPSAVSEGGRRLYSDKDVVRLHQVLSLKSLGFSLGEIRAKLVAVDTPGEAAAMLEEQGRALQAQIDVLSRALEDICALREEVLQMQSVDFGKYADIIVNLQMKNENYRLIKYFDDGMLDYLRKRFDRESGSAFIGRFEALRERAVRYSGAGIAPGSAEGQAFAEEFWQLIVEFTGGDMRMLPQVMKMGEVASADAEWKRKTDILNGFLSPALEIYFAKAGISPFEVKND